MRSSLVILILLCFGSIRAQKNYAKELLSTQWYQDVSNSKNGGKNNMVFRKLNDKIPTKEKTIFRADGVIKRCFSEIESLGGDMAVTCDSAFHYQIKKDLIHISDQNIMHIYYKMKLIPDGIELKPIEPELFYKNK